MSSRQPVTSKSGSIIPQLPGLPGSDLQAPVSGWFETPSRLSSGYTQWQLASQHTCYWIPPLPCLSYGFLHHVFQNHLPSEMLALKSMSCVWFWEIQTEADGHQGVSQDG